MARDQPQSRSDGPAARRYWCKVFQTKHDLVGAFCDEDIIGETIEDGKLKVKVSRDFYGGALIDERVALRVMEKVTIGNLMGEQIVEAAMEAGFITGENLIFIGGIPHAQFIRLSQG